MIRDPLDQPDVVVREVAEGGRARQQLHARIPGEFGEAPRKPGIGRLAVDVRSRAIEERAAGLRLLVAENDTRAAFGRRDRRGNARGPRADDKHVAVRVALGVSVRVRRRWARARVPPRAGSAAHTVRPRPRAAT